MEKNQLLRKLPKMDELLNEQIVKLELDKTMRIIVIESLRESVDFYRDAILKGEIKDFSEREILEDFKRRVEIKKQSNFKNVTLLVEPLGLGFLGENNVDLSSKNRSDSVLYNPSKNSKTLQKLLKRTDIIFKPISGYQDFELVDLFRNSKLYIDFGFFGCPERLPKETVLNGTMLLVGKRNASVNSFDIAIPDKYKIEDADDIEFIASKIKQMLLDYDQIIGDFRGFREKIINLEPNFIKSIKSIFIKA